MSNTFSSSLAISAVVKNFLSAAKSGEELSEIAEVLRSSLTECSLLLKSHPKIPKRKELRVFLNGCFDIMHAGHYNALRQAKATFVGEAEKVVLVVGVHSDAAITAQKGPTVMNDDERCSIVRGCKFVDEVVAKLPYSVPVALLDKLKCDFVVHGDDMPICQDGTGMYSEAIAKKRFRLIKRTEGMSTTLLIGRLLLMSKDHLMKSCAKPDLDKFSTTPSAEGNDQAQDSKIAAALKSMGTLLPTTERMSQFHGNDLNGKARLLANAKRVVYVKGAFDMFHTGHLAFLKKSRALGDYLIVGLHADEVVNQARGSNSPVMNLHERAMCVLSCRYVDDVVYGAPWQVTQDLITTMNVSFVACGRIGSSTAKMPAIEGLDPYAVPREAGILVTIHTGVDMSTDVFIDRIMENRDMFLKRNNKKMQSEVEYLEKRKSFVAES